MISSKMKFKHPREKPAANKRGRLVIRNLPFTTSEEILRNHFSPYGTINDFSLLKKPDGKLVGCGFIQFDRKQSAAKAIHYLSGKPFMGRPIIVDWAISKKKFGAVNKSDDVEENVEVKEEPLPDVSDVPIKEEPNDVESEDEFDTQEELTEIKTEKCEDTNKPCPTPSHDINEGKTVFLKNVPFNCTNDELKAFMEEIGPVYYAVTCIDPQTEHAKGTAFVKFKNQKDAFRCTERVVELNFKNHDMLALPALPRKDLNKRDTERYLDKQKDSRNLYLIKEGVIIAGTKAAIDVSISDMKKRSELESWKINILRNLNMFVSRTRLVIHNLPLSYDDKMLRSLFKKHAPPRSKIIEAKVMRNMRQLDKNDKPVSKGYGFVSFTTHEHALVALRNVNNNPNIFNKNKRPIVAFSIENRVVHKIKQKRAEKSKLNNPLCPDSKKSSVKNRLESENTKIRRRNRSDVLTFTGMEAHPKTTITLMPKRRFVNQSALHRLNVNQSKKETKRKRFVEEIRKEKKQEQKVKPVKKKRNKYANEKEFSQLVEKYKQKLNPNISLKKWYETE